MHAFQNVLVFGLFALLLYWQEHLSVTNISGPIYKHTHIKYGWHLWLTQWQTASHFKQIIKFPRPTCPNGRSSLTKKHVAHTHLRGAGHWWRACSSVSITEEDMQLFHAFASCKCQCFYISSISSHNLLWAEKTANCIGDNEPLPINTLSLRSLDYYFWP